MLPEIGEGGEGERAVGEGGEGDVVDEEVVGEVVGG